MSSKWLQVSNGSLSFLLVVIYPKRNGASNRGPMDPTRRSEADHCEASWPPVRGYQGGSFLRPRDSFTSKVKALCWNP